MKIKYLAVFYLIILMGTSLNATRVREFASLSDYKEAKYVEIAQKEEQSLREKYSGELVDEFYRLLTLNDVPGVSQLIESNNKFDSFFKDFKYVLGEQYLRRAIKGTPTRIVSFADSYDHLVEDYLKSLPDAEYNLIQGLDAAFTQTHEYNSMPCKHLLPFVKNIENCVLEFYVSELDIEIWDQECKTLLAQNILWKNPFTR